MKFYTGSWKWRQRKHYAHLKLLNNKKGWSGKFCYYVSPEGVIVDSVEKNKAKAYAKRIRLFSKSQSKEYIFCHQTTDWSKVNVTNLPFVLYVKRAKLPEEPGIYFVVDQSKVLYVGKAKCIKTRHRSHETLHSFDQLSKISNLKIHYLTLPIHADLTAIENQFIKRFKPILNAQGNTWSREISISLWEDYVDAKLGII